MGDKIKNIQDMLNLYYNNGRLPASVMYGEFPGMGNVFGRKTDDPIDTGDTGIFNPVYGAEEWSFLNEEADFWKLLKKVPYDKLGWRVTTAWPTVTGHGQSESGAINDTIKPTIGEEVQYPKWILHPWENTHKVRALSNLDDGLKDLEAYMRKEFMDIHAKGINGDLLVDASAAAAGAGENTTNASGDNIETADRLISNNSEENAFGGSWTGWFDAYGDPTQWDRDGGTTYDAVVDHDSGSDRALSLDIVDDLIKNVRIGGAKKSELIFVTGHDTFYDWSRLIDPKHRIQSDEDVTVTQNGVQSVGGAEGIVRVGSYDRIPIFETNDMMADGASRILLIEQNHFFIKILFPTLMIDTADNDVLLIDALKNKHAYITAGQVICTDPGKQGKIRDLS